MTDGQLNANVDQYLQAAAMNTPPPQIVSDPLVTGVTPVEQLLRVLGLAANLGDPQDNAEATDEHARRDAKTTEAAEKFAAQDEDAAQVLNTVAEQADPFAIPLGVGGAELGAGSVDPIAGPGGAGAVDQAAAMAQQLPQVVSSIAGALSGALGGALQPLAQIPQQIAQGAQQAMQTGTSLFQHASTPTGDVDLTLDPLTDEFDSIPDDFAGSSGGDFGSGITAAGAGDVGGFGAGMPGGTTPTALLGPAPIPSIGTAPSSSPFTQISPPSATTAAPPGHAGMAGMPMVPPGAMAGAANADKDAKTTTRRVSVPPVRNGAPVQGRLTTPPSLPQVTKKVDGKPVASRRIVLPAKGSADGATDATSD